MLAAPPEVALINTEAVLLVEAEDDGIAAARESFALQHAELASLRAEARLLPH